MKILKDWIKFAEDMERLIQPGSPISAQLTCLKSETQIQLGLCEIKKEIREDEITDKEIREDDNFPWTGINESKEVHDLRIKNYKPITRANPSDDKDEPKNSAELNDQIGYGHNDFDND